MPLVKVMSPENEVRVAIMATSTAELIQKAIVQLELSDKTYKIFMEDGTQILDDEVFCELDKYTQLVVLKEGMSYNDYVGKTVQEKSIQSNTQIENSTDTRETISNQAAQQNVNEKQSLMKSLLSKVSESIIDNCEQGKNLCESQMKSLVARIRYFTREELKDTTRGTTMKIVQELCEKYPETFSIEIADGSSLSLEASLFIRVYNSIIYENMKELKKNGGRKRMSTNVNDPEITKQKFQKQGEYGCAPGQYCPSLPLNEETIMTDKCEKLAEYYGASEAVDDDTVKKLMEETYALQRNDIVFSYPCLDDRFFSKWPYFQKYQILLQHANKLIGVDSLEDTWATALGQYAKHIRKYLKYEEVTKSHNSQEKMDLFVKNNIKKAKNYSKGLNQSQIPRVTVIFSLIIHYFEEEESLLYMVIDNNLTEKQIVEVVPNYTPTLVVKGQSIWDEKATFYIVMNKKSVVMVNGLCNGLLLTFLYYFIYSLCYPQKLCRTLEFIQRFFLKMNPPKGSKKDSKSRQLNIVDPKVQKLMKNLTDFIKKQETNVS